MGGMRLGAFNQRESRIRPTKLHSNVAVDTFYRVYGITTSPAFEKWGEAFPDVVKRMVRKKSGQQLWNFIHAIYHRDGAKGEKGKPVNSTSKHNASIHYSYTGGT